MPGNHRKKLDLPPKTCVGCGVEFMPKKRGSYRKAKYCSRECSARSRQEQNSEKRACRNCGKEHWVPKARLATHPGAGTYCSNECKLADWSKRSLAAGRAGNYRANAWKVYERRCYDCGYDERPEVILVHHIDGNHSNGVVENLIPVCPTCHVIRHIELTGSTRVPTWRG